jgi:hypothetical protein
MELADGERTAGNLQSGLKEVHSTFKDLHSRHVVRYDRYWMEEQDHLPFEMRRFWEHGGSVTTQMPLPIKEGASEESSQSSQSTRQTAGSEATVSQRFREDLDRYACDHCPSFTASRMTLERGVSGASGNKPDHSPSHIMASTISDSCGFVWDCSPTAPATGSTAFPGAVGCDTSSQRVGRGEDCGVSQPPERRPPGGTASKENVEKQKDIQIGRVVLLIEMELMGAIPGRREEERPRGNRGAEERLTLREWLHRSDRTFSTAADVFGMLMLSVRHIHRKRLVHADLKPDNIFIVAERSKNSGESKVLAVRIGDFGLAGENKLFRQFSYGVRQKSFSTGGTPGYLAPEVLSKESLCSDKADIYACAVILLEVLLPPFETRMERVEFLDGFRLRNEVPRFVEDRLPKTRALLKDMGTMDPACRWSAEEVCKFFEKEVRKELCHRIIAQQRCCSPKNLQADRRKADGGDPEHDVENRRQKARSKHRGKQRLRR